MKKYIKCIIICFCIMFLSVGISQYFSSVSLNAIISNHTQIQMIEKASVRVYTSVHLTKLYEVNKKETVDDLLNVFENIKVRRTILPPDKFKPLLYNTYYLILFAKTNAIIISVMDKNYLIVNNRVYKIINKPNLKLIYDTLSNQTYKIE